MGFHDRIPERPAYRIDRYAGLKRGKHTSSFPIVLNDMELSGRPGKQRQVVVHHVAILTHRDGRKSLVRGLLASEDPDIHLGLPGRKHLRS